MIKPKISEKQFILLILGPSCGGKSSVSNDIMEKYGGIFNAKYDTIKWLISDYGSIRYRTAVYNIIITIIKSALEQNLSVIKEGSFRPKDIIEIGKNYNVPVFIADISAPKKVLNKRFEERVEKKNENPNAKIANTNKDRFDGLYKMYLETKIDTSLRFDSSSQEAEEIANEIVDYIKSNI